MGKTCLVKKMVAEVPKHKLVVYRDLEGVRTPLEFAQTIFDDVESYLSHSQQTAAKAREWLKHLTGLEIGGVVKFPTAVAPHWKTLLTKTIEDLVENQERTVIFFWDEMPLMLYNIKKRESEDAVAEVLDTLRSLRQMHPQLRMVYTGSIGLHNVLTSLKRTGYANAPTNDMGIIDVPPLCCADAKELALRLLEGEAIETLDLQALTSAIASAVDGIPYFIHHIIDELVVQGSPVEVITVNEIVNTYLIDPQDSWHLRYYRERIETYYDNEEKPLALNLLDVLAVADHPLPFDELFNRLQSGLDNADSDRARVILTLLQRDHYVIQQTNGAFLFRFPLIQRCWQLHRGLRI
jgi:hypothetical protein